MPAHREQRYLPDAWKAEAERRQRLSEQRREEARAQEGRRLLPAGINGVVLALCGLGCAVTVVLCLVLSGVLMPGLIR